MESGKADQPQSTITPSDDQYILFDDPSATIDYSTSQAPTPNCSDDTPDGDPDYFWDYGDLDGIDNGDGTLTIKSDVEDDYHVTVYCEQTFTDSNGTDYTVDTQISN